MQLHKERPTNYELILSCPYKEKKGKGEKNWNKMHIYVQDEKHVIIQFNQIMFQKLFEG